MKQSTIKKYIQFLTEVKNSGKTLYEYCNNKCWEENNGIKYEYKSLINNINTLKRAEPNKDIQKILDLYSEITSQKKRRSLKQDTIEKLDTDDVSETSYIRNDSGKIKLYSFKIFKKNKPALSGNLTREEMASIYRLYSYYGASLTQRQISRYFPDYSLIDFKRILRAFNITKASSPFPPHMIEEKTEDELRKIQLREKENDFLRKSEEDIIKNNEKLLRKYAQENIVLKEKLKTFSDFKVDLNGDIKPIKLTEFTESDQSLNLYLADIHLGSAVTSGTLATENIDYGYEEAKRRLSKVLQGVYDLGAIDQLNIVLLGDNVDCCGIPNKTARLDHWMPQNMDVREQANKYIELIDWFVSSCVSNNIANKISLYSVPCGNHSGDYEYVCNKAIMNLVQAKYPDVLTTLWDQFYGVFELNNHKFIACHGKDAAYMKRGLPLVLNDKTQVQMYEFLEQENIHNCPVHVVKGDLHSNSYTSCKRFDYRNTLSLYGSSDYSAMNFSASSYGVSYDLMIGDNIVRGEFQNM